MWVCAYKGFSHCLPALCNEDLQHPFFHLKVVKFYFCDCQFVRFKWKDLGFTPDNHHPQGAAGDLYWCNYMSRTHSPHNPAHSHIHICLLNCPNILLTSPPEKGSSCHSCQWDFWVFKSPWVNPLQLQIDLISNGAKKGSFTYSCLNQNNADYIWWESPSRKEAADFSWAVSSPYRQEVIIITLLLIQAL